MIMQCPDRATKHLFEGRRRDDAVNDVDHNRVHERELRARLFEVAHDAVGELGPHGLLRQEGIGKVLEARRIEHFAARPHADARERRQQASNHDERSRQRAMEP